MLQYQATQDGKSVIDMSLMQRRALRSITGWIGKLNPSGYRVNTDDRNRLAFVALIMKSPWWRPVQRA
jgi:hypothetical protein